VIGAGTLAAIWVKRSHRGPMDAATAGELVAGRGLVGNADQGRRRQVTLIEEEIWTALMRELGRSHPTSGRRANLVLRGLRLAESRGRELRVGPCVLRINGETRPCERMNEVAPGLRELMKANWGGGVFAEVLVGGPLHVGDDVSWAEACVTPLG
jgi:MOSC domain-containing protein YiiM